MSKLKVFLSWSGQPSKGVAACFARWLPDAFQQIDTWMSEIDIAAGTRWSDELKASLDDSEYGLLFLDHQNLNSHWMLFEAGYLTKSISSEKIVPVMIDLLPIEMPAPLSLHQAMTIEKHAVVKFAKELNGFTPLPLPDDRVERIVQNWWPSIDTEVSRLTKLHPRPPDARPHELTEDDQLLSELLRRTIRLLERRLRG